MKTQVSVICISYNQEKFIKQTIASFLMQETNFDFEIIIADDCSKDGTQQIIQNFANSDDRITTILRTKNIGPLPNFYDALKKSKGRYIAICEGDDYWTDPHKLQKQFDYLESHKKAALCFHPVEVVYEDGSAENYVFPDPKTDKKFTVDELLHDNFIQTNSVMYRRQDYSHLPPEITPADWYFHLYHARHGELGFISDVMSVYRKHPGGMWWNNEHDIDAFWLKNGLNHLLIHQEFLKLFETRPELHPIIYHSAYRAFRNFSKMKNNSVEMLQKAIKKFPTLASSFIKDQVATIDRLEKQSGEVHAVLQAHKDQVVHLSESVHLKDQHIQNIENELHRIKSSRSWKMVEASKKIKRLHR